MTTAPARQRRLSMGLSPGQPEPRLYDRVVEMLRTSRYSRRTDAGSFCHNPPDRLRKNTGRERSAQTRQRGLLRGVEVITK